MKAVLIVLVFLGTEEPSMEFPFPTLVACERALDTAVTASPSSSHVYSRPLLAFCRPLQPDACNAADITGDGVVGTPDYLVLSAYLGNTCDAAE